MKTLLTVLTLGLLVAGMGSTDANAAASKKAKKKIVRGEMKTKHNFDDHGVHGQYQMPDEALAKVENEKSLSDLLGVRQHFKDRLQQASGQE